MSYYRFHNDFPTNAWSWDAYWSSVYKTLITTELYSSPYDTVEIPSVVQLLSFSSKTSYNVYWQLFLSDNLARTLMRWHLWSLALAGTDFAPRVALAALLQWIQGVSFISTLYKRNEIQRRIYKCVEKCQIHVVKGEEWPPPPSPPPSPSLHPPSLHPPAAVAGVLLRVGEPFELNQLKISPFTASTGFFRIWPVANLLPLI